MKLTKSEKERVLDAYAQLDAELGSDLYINDKAMVSVVTAIEAAIIQTRRDDAPRKAAKRRESRKFAKFLGKLLQ